MIHYYKDKEFRLVRDGSKWYPWNIYKWMASPYSRTKEKSYWHVGFARTLKECKSYIDTGCYEECEWNSPS